MVPTHIQPPTRERPTDLHPTTHYTTRALSTTQYSIPTHDHVLDYEVAIRNAAYTVFPGINIKGCVFHYTQCIWRNAQRHGLQIAYNKSDDIHLLVRRAAVLPLHPLNTIEDYWFNALEDIDSADTNIATLGFTDYITSYWVEENRHLWNHYATEGPRTTNHLKGWHGKLKNLVKAPHPNIYRLIQLLKHEKPSTHAN